VTQLGQYPEPQHTLVHLSDTHFLSGGAALYGSVGTEKNLLRALGQLERSGIHPEALVFTGDLADLGEPDAYRRLREMVEPVADRLGAQVIWVMGNHDERLQYSKSLFDVDGSDAPQDRAYNLSGLRIISLDTTVPGYHHGALTDAQLDWLAEELKTPAPHGSFVALHHPPIPLPLMSAMELLELHGQERLAAVIRGSDVRGILGGHLHFSTHSLFADVPVSVAAATCYTMDLMDAGQLIAGVDAAQAFNVVSVYEDRVVHTVVPIGDAVPVTSFPESHRARIEGMTPAERLEVFSKKGSAFNRGVDSP
jgi:3',5'-cyclic AMP phosphodiesterase CpdA